jgi:IS30 family transposase
VLDSNENLNGLIMKYISKKNDFNEFTDLKTKEIENKINCRPRRRYGYENPIFVMGNFLFNPKVTFLA